MTQIVKWQNTDYVPRAGLEAWHMYEPAVTGNEIIYDYSGNNRTVSCAVSGSPVLQSDKINNEPAHYFDGTSNPLVYTGAVTARHLFVVGSFEETTLAAFRGIFTDKTTYSLLVGDNATTKIFRFVEENYSYEKNDRAFASGDQQAPMSGTFAVMEVLIDSALILDGIQIGQNKTQATHKHKGWFAESLLYSTVKNTYERQKIYEYFARRYKIWQESAAGLKVFPFTPNHARVATFDQEFHRSNPYSGQPKTRIKGNRRGEFDLGFFERRQSEFEAAAAFHDQHYPPQNDFVYIDRKYAPDVAGNNKEFTCEITSSFNDAGSGLTAGLWNYQFMAKEVES